MTPLALAPYQQEAHDFLLLAWGNLDYVPR